MGHIWHLEGYDYSLNLDQYFWVDICRTNSWWTALKQFYTHRKSYSYIRVHYRPL